MSLRRNTAYGVLGFVLPSLVVFLAYPVVLRAVGAEAFGVFLLASGLAGSIAFLELGFTTAIVRFLAEDLARDDRESAGSIVSTALAFYAALGVPAFAAVWFLAPVLARLARVTPGNEAQAVTVFRIAAFQLAAGYQLGAFVAVFKGVQRFEASTWVQTAGSVLTWGTAAAGVTLAAWTIVPVAVTSSVVTVLAAAVSGRLAVVLLRERGVLLSRCPPRIATFRRMLRFGVFAFANGTIGFLAAQLQTWVMAAFLGPTAVTITSTANQIISKINQVVSAGFETLVPVAAELAGGRREAGLRELRKIYDKALAIALVTSIGAAVALFVIAPTLMRVWLRSDIDGSVAEVMRILALGLMVNGATPVAFHVVNGIGKPELNTAFMIPGIVIFYAGFAAFLPGGLTVQKFAWAQSVSLAVGSLLFLVGAHRILWRRLLLPAAGAPGPGAEVPSP